jgi:peptidase E
MKLLLTSNGLENKEIGYVFKNLFSKDIKLVKILFIPTASRTKDELFYVNKSKEELI